MQHLPPVRRSPVEISTFGVYDFDLEDMIDD